MPPPEPVILLHGIYMHGLCLVPLARWLQCAGFRPIIFNYPSLRRTPAANAVQLGHRVRQLDASTVHYLGHSLGGLVLRHLMAVHEPGLPPGRTVTLGTPHRGSLVAHRLQARRMGWLLGASRARGLLGDAPVWPATRELGSIAGVSRHGIGLLVTTLPQPHDGTVTVDETRCPTMRDHIVLPHNHTGLLLAADVVAQTAAFLRYGHFQH